ncbi:MAG: CoA-binding protein [Candidatus Paceibacterota bacterium]
MLKYIFNPKTVALIGASNKPKTVGNGIALNLLKGKQKIFFVNPNRRKILKQESYPSILDIKETIDLAVIAVPAKIVPSILKECQEKKVKGVIIISSGFSEVGNIKEEEKLKIDLPLVGPNCLGIINTKNNLNASFSPFMPKKGNIGVLSQSGAILDTIIDIAKDESYGFSKIVSFGNEAGLDLSDYIHYLEKDKETDVIAIYIEGIKNGRKFFNAISKSSKPIIILKSGKSNLGREAALTHTGSLAGDSKIYSSVFKQGKAIEVDSIEELLDVSKTLSWHKRQKGSVHIVTNGGGFGVLAVDAFEKEKIKVFSPIDLLGDALASKYETAIEELLKKKDVACVYVIQGLQIMTEPEKTAKIIVKLKKKYNKPIIVSFLGGASFDKAIRIIEKNKIPNFNEIKRAVKVIKHLVYEK